MQVDQNNNGDVDFEEFKALVVLALDKAEKEEHMKSLFNQFDADSSGSMSVDELSIALSKMGMPLTATEVSDMVAQVGSLTSIASIASAQSAPLLALTA